MNWRERLATFLWGAKCIECGTRHRRRLADFALCWARRQRRPHA